MEISRLAMTTLTASIEFWKTIVTTENILTAGSKQAEDPLCVRYAGRKDPKMDCMSCPVKRMTWGVQCSETPYPRIGDAVHQQDVVAARTAALGMLDTFRAIRDQCHL